MLVDESNCTHFNLGAGLAQAAPAWKKPALSPAEGPVLGRVQGRKAAQHRLFHGGAAQRQAHALDKRHQVCIIAIANYSQ